MDTFQEWAIKAVNWLISDFWLFIRPFCFGSIGGWAAVLMAQVYDDSKFHLRERKLLFISKEKESVIAEFEKIKKHELKFRSKMRNAYVFVGGVSGMIAVSSFNPDSNNLQTFVIAVIAGVSGFAFLKRSALIDDKTSDELLNGTKDEDELKKIMDGLEILKDSSTNLYTNSVNPELPMVIDDELLSEELLEDGLIDEDLLGEEASENIDIDSLPIELKEIVQILNENPEFNESDLKYIKNLWDSGISIAEIIERFNKRI